MRKKSQGQDSDKYSRRDIVPAKSAEEYLESALILRLDEHSI